MTNKTPPETEPGPGVLDVQDVYDRMHNSRLIPRLEAENARLKAALAQAKVYLRAFIPNPKPSHEYRIRAACKRLDQIASGMDDKS